MYGLPGLTCRIPAALISGRETAVAEELYSPR